VDKLGTKEDVDLVGNLFYKKHFKLIDGEALGHMSSRERYDSWMKIYTIVKQENHLMSFQM
jgi:hypothetical protein